MYSVFYGMYGIELEVRVAQFGIELE